jgi:hypothetical protein
MPRTRNTPTTRPAIEIDTVEQFGVVMAYNENGSVDTDNVKFTYIVNNRSSAGDVIESQQRVLPFANWPNPVKAELKAIYLRVLADAESQGLIGAGTDTDDLRN